MSGKILIISDLHLGDKRVPPEFEAMRLDALAAYIRQSAPVMVLNLGDTVSRSGCLREGEPGGEASFARYLQWRSMLNIPFRECAIPREFPFFEKIFHQSPDSIDETVPGLCVITMTPYWKDDHHFSTRQTDFLTAALAAAKASRILIGTHVPYPGSCSRTIAPGIYCEVPEKIVRAIETCGKEVYWCGGHFHWAPDPPYHQKNLTAMIAARFMLPGERSDRFTFVRTLDAESGEIETFTPDNW